MPDADRIRDNLTAVRKRIAEACERSSRDLDTVCLIAVTKTVGCEEVRILHELGVEDFGENRMFDGLAKVDELSALNARWHFIGHLQRNKARQVLVFFNLIHSVESGKLVDAIAKHASESGKDVEILLEVNISGDKNKYGAVPAAAASLVRNIDETQGIRLLGLMTMAPWVAEAEETRCVFRGLRELRDLIEDERGLALPELSMGMSNDFEIAIEEGATMVRVGRLLFQ